MDGSSLAVFLLFFAPSVAATAIAPRRRSFPILALVATAAGSLGLVHAPFHSAAYLATEEGASGDALLPWAAPFREALPWAFQFTDTWGVYRAIGTAEPFVLAGMLAGIWIVHRRQAHREGRVGRYAFYGLFAAQALFAGATAVEYFTPFRDEAFMVGFPALLAGLLAFVVYGILTLRAKVLPRDVGWLLIGGAVAFIPMAAMFGHIAMAMTLLNAVLIRIGLLELRSASAKVPAS